MCDRTKNYFCWILNLYFASVSSVGENMNRKENEMDFFLHVTQKGVRGFALVNVFTNLTWFNLWKLFESENSKI